MHLAGQQILIPAPVVAEVGYLLAREAGSTVEAAFLRSLADGDFATVAPTATDYARMADLVIQYGDLPTSPRNEAQHINAGHRAG